MRNDRIAGTLAHWLRRGTLVLALALAACGGGSGDNDSSSSAGTGGTGPQQPAGSNAVTVTVASGVAGVRNIPTVSVTICAPGTGTCQTVDNVQVDTESFGLRLMSSALSPSMASALPAGGASGAGGGTLAECLQFGDGSFMWGTVRTADVKIGGETASAIPIQVAGDLSASIAPSTCQDPDLALNTPARVGANGILGIGVAPTDCPGCTNASGSIYYLCPSGGGSCTNTAVSVAQQVATPVARFAGDNNGVILQMPAVGAGGAPTATGTLIFGIGTQPNNTFAASQKLATDPAGDFIATFNGSRMRAFLDSGSNGLFFVDSSVTPCTGNFHDFYCPSSTQTLSATLTGIDGATNAGVSFDVANAVTLFNSGNYALGNLGGPYGSSSTLDLGLPFFYGRTVYYGYDRTASGGAAPFVAF